MNCVQHCRSSTSRSMDSSRP